MYSVFFVDDEIVIREGIRNHALWEMSDFVLAGEAPDGEIALSMLQDIRPDILITDIRMPFMDGLELVRQAKQSMPWLHVIILSGYDDFSYARQALTLGVHDYLLKPVSAEDLLCALDKVAVQIQNERRAKADMQALREQFSVNSQYLKEKIILELFQPNLQSDAILEIESRARKMELILRAGCYTTLLVKPTPSETPHEDAMQLSTQLRRLAATSGGAVHFCDCCGDSVMLVMGDNDADLDERAYGLAQTIRRELSQASGIDVRISVGKTVMRLRDIAASFAQARRVDSAADDALVSNGPAKPILGIEDLLDDTGLSLPELNILPIQQQMQYVTSADIDIVLDRYIESLGESALHSTMMMHYVYVETMLAASRIVKESGGNPSEVLPEQNESSLQAITNEAQLKEILREILLKSIEFREACASSKHDMIIRRAQAFIHENYQNAAISLKDAAEYVALSNNHFCTVFSQETGQTFTEYLTCLRLNKAKEMMRNTAMRTSEIAYKVGYNDPHYFSYLFKRNMGKSPREYRRECEAENA